MTSPKTKTRKSPKAKAGKATTSPRTIDGMRPEFVDGLIELYEQLATKLGGDKAAAKIAAAKKKAFASRKRRKAA